MAIRSEPKKMTWSTGGETGDMSGTITSTPFKLAGLKTCSFELSWPATSTPVGTISVEVSNSYHPLNNASATFDALDSSLFYPALTHPTGGAGRCPIDLEGIGAEYIRVRYTRSSGGGALTGYQKAKE